MTRKELYRRVPYAYLDAPGAKTFVYAIKCGEFIKIGIAKDVGRRLSEINLCNPYRSTVAIQAEVASCLALKVEQDLHSAFAKRRHWREWFKLAPSDMRDEFWRVVGMARQIEEKYQEMLDAYLRAREKDGTPKWKAREILVNRYTLDH